MQRIVAAILLTAWTGFSCNAAASVPQSEIPSTTRVVHAGEKSTITVPSGTKVALTLTSPIWSKSAKVGDSIHSVTSFPVAVGNDMAIPPGTYVEGRIDGLTRPSWRSNHAEFQFHFTKLVFANGYTVELRDVLENFDSTGNRSVSVNAALAGTTAEMNHGVAVSVDIEAAIARVYIEVTSRNDILLDNGAPIEMLLQSPLSLDAGFVAAAVSRAKPLQISATKSSTKCLPTLGTPGTSDTVIPGSPGTPDTVIPGAPGMPDTVIPGIPATPPMVIPGTPGTPGTACPGPPIVASIPVGKDEHTKIITLTSPMQLGGVLLSPGKYQLRWSGLGPTAQIQFLQNKKPAAQVNARIVILSNKPPADESAPRRNADGTISLALLEFAGESFALIFD
jgi:hypothetical protein